MTLQFTKKLFYTLALIPFLFFASACSEKPTPKAEPSPAAPAAKPTNTGSDNTLLSKLEQRAKAGYGVGYAAVIVDGDKIEFINAGLADKKTGQKITEDSLFEIGSITKTFTALLLADMALKGELSLDDPASKYLPASVTMPRYEGKDITLRHLATHTSALPRLPSNLKPANLKNPYADYTPALMYDFLSNHELKRPVGETIEYSNLGMGLLGHILELKTGLSYEDLVAERILAPLGMSNTFIAITEDNRTNLTTGHGGAGQTAQHWDFGELAGAGALRSSSADMTLYLRANMGLTETPLFAAMELSHEFQLDMPQAGHYIGLAWFTNKTKSGDIIWHNGATYGYQSFIGFDKAKGRGVIVLTNSQDNAERIGKAAFKNTPDDIAVSQENKDITFTQDELENYVGAYPLVPEFVITITRQDTSLFAQATGQAKFPIYAKSKTEFFYKVVDAQITFNINSDGKIDALTLNQNGQTLKAPKQ